LLSNVFGVASRRPDASPASASISLRVMALALTGLSTSRHRLHFKLSAPARVSFKFTRHAKRHFVRKFSVSAKSGANSVPFKGRLRAGTYRLTATARDAFGNRAAPRHLTARLR
jgi:hypothetical protein